MHHKFSKNYECFMKVGTPINEIYLIPMYSFIDLKSNRLHKLSIKDKLINNYLNYYSAEYNNKNCFTITIFYT